MKSVNYLLSILLTLLDTDNRKNPEKLIDYQKMMINGLIEQFRFTK